MKHNVRKFLSLLLAFSMVLSLMSVSVFAEYTVEDGAVTVNSLEDLQSALSDDSVTTIVANPMGVTADTEIDLKGKTIQAPGALLFQVGSSDSRDCTLTINDSVGGGRIVSTEENARAGTIYLRFKTNLVLNGGTIAGNSQKPAVYLSAGGASATINDNGSVEGLVSFDISTACISSVSVNNGTSVETNAPVSITKTNGSESVMTYVGGLSKAADILKAETDTGAKYTVTVDSLASNADFTTPVSVSLSGGLDITLDLGGNTINRVLNVQSGSVTIKNGTLTRASSTSNDSSLTISGGTVTIEEGATIDNGSKDNSIVATSGTLVISGGTIKGGVRIDDGVTITISGGTFDCNPSTYVDTDKYAIVEDNGTYTVVEAAAEYNGIKYATLQDAIDAVPNNTTNSETVYTVKLLKSVTDAAGLATQTRAADGNPKNLIIDFGGFTYSMKTPAVGSSGTETQALHWAEGSNITMKNGTFTVQSNAVNVKQVMQNYCNLTLDGMIIDATHVNGGRYGYFAPDSPYAFWSYKSVPVFNFNKGTSIIKDSTISFRAADNMGLVSASALTIEGDTRINGNITVIGGETTITSADVTGAAVAANNGIISITGGKFASDPSKYLADGKIAIKTGDMYVVTNKPTNATSETATDSDGTTTTEVATATIDANTNAKITTITTKDNEGTVTATASVTVATKTEGTTTTETAVVTLVDTTGTGESATTTETKIDANADVESRTVANVKPDVLVKKTQEFKADTQTASVDEVKLEVKKELKTDSTMGTVVYSAKPVLVAYSNGAQVGEAKELDNAELATDGDTAKTFSVILDVTGDFAIGRTVSVTHIHDDGSKEDPVSLAVVSGDSYEGYAGKAVVVVPNVTSFSDFAVNPDGTTTDIAVSLVAASNTGADNILTGATDVDVNSNFSVDLKLVNNTSSPITLTSGAFTLDVPTDVTYVGFVKASDITGYFTKSNANENILAWSMPTTGGYTLEAGATVTLGTFTLNIPVNSGSDYHYGSVIPLTLSTYTLGDNAGHDEFKPVLNGDSVEIATRYTYTLISGTDAQFADGAKFASGDGVSSDGKTQTVMVGYNLTPGDNAFPTILTPAYTAYDFKGWNTIAGQTTGTPTADLGIVNNDTTYYAAWEAHPYSITYAESYSVAEGATALQTEYTIENGVVGTPVKAGYKFLGWEATSVTDGNWQQSSDNAAFYLYNGTTATKNTYVEGKLTLGDSGLKLYGDVTLKAVFVLDAKVELVPYGYAQATTNGTGNDVGQLMIIGYDRDGVSGLKYGNDAVFTIDSGEGAKYIKALDGENSERSSVYLYLVDKDEDAASALMKLSTDSAAAIAITHNGDVYQRGVEAAITSGDWNVVSTLLLGSTRTDLTVQQRLEADVATAANENADYAGLEDIVEIVKLYLGN